MGEDIAIKVEHVSKDFSISSSRANTIKSVLTGFHKEKQTDKNTQHALKDINFEIKSGEFFGIVGRNGSGKSTLLKIIAGIYQPNKGEVHIRGKLVPFIELGVGFNPDLTGRENVYMNGALLGFSEAEITGFYDSVVEFAELEKFMDKKLKNYSSGMQVRLAFAMAIRAKADILLIDEVLAVGDADFQRKCYDYFRKLKKEKKTVVFVSHDMSAIREFCDRAALIEKSQLKKINSPATIAQEYDELFLNEQTNETQLNKLTTSRRNGSGAVRIKEASLDKSVFTPKDEEIKLTVKLEAFGPQSQLMTGFAIKNAQGQFINSHHTWDDKLILPDLEPGETLGVTFVCPNIYEDGLYTIDVYSYGSNHEVYDSLEESMSFRVKRPNRSGGMVVVPAKAIINEKPSK
jgi:ABC-2 type transport system ATP-binding protein